MCEHKWLLRDIWTEDPDGFDAERTFEEHECVNCGIIEIREN